jgi:urease accessory protein
MAALAAARGAVTSDGAGVGSARGRLELVFGTDTCTGQVGAARTRLRHSLQLPPLRVVRPFDLPRGGVLVHLHNVSGGVLGGDQLDNEIRLEQGARVQVTTTGSTRIYRHRAEEHTAQQVTRCNVGPDALLEVLPDSLIPYAGSRYRQVTSYQLAPGAGLLAWELVTPGREAHGERFVYDLLELQTTILAGTVPLASERMQLQPGLRPLDSPLRLGRYSSFATFYACRVGQTPEAWPELEHLLGELAAEHNEVRSEVGECVWGVSTLPAHGVVVRGLGVTQRRLAGGLPIFWSAARKFLYGEEGILPRKLY